jgi:hypothetical protein
MKAGAYRGIFSGLFLIFAKLASSIDSLYLIQKSTSETETRKIFIDLLRLSKDSTQAYDYFENSYVIKRITKFGVARIHNIFRKQKDLSNH